MPRAEASREPTLAEAIKLLKDLIKEEIRVCLPGKVEAYDAKTQTASVTPMLAIPNIDAYGTIFADKIPTLEKIPVLWPRAGDFFITMPLARGDKVAIFFVDTQMDDFQFGTGDSVSAPKILRYHDESDAFIVPGLYPTLTPLLDSALNGSVLALGVDKKGMQIHIEKGSIKIVAGIATLFEGSSTAITLEAAGSTIEISASGVDINGNLKVLP